MKYIHRRSCKKYNFNSMWTTGKTGKISQYREANDKEISFKKLCHKERLMSSQSSGSIHRKRRSGLTEQLYQDMNLQNGQCKVIPCGFFETIAGGPSGDRRARDLERARACRNRFNAGSESSGYMGLVVSGHNRQDNVLYTALVFFNLN